MGIDYLDLTFRIEKEFGVKVALDDLKQFLDARYHPEILSDFEVKDLVDFVTDLLEQQKPAENVDVFIRTKKQIVECLGCDEWTVTPNAKLIKDLGME
jgi:acyl carrier protein